jgi:putative glutamine amidotransferase
MTRIGITQRVSVVEEYGERRDCLDQEWTRYLESFDLVPIPLPNTVSDVSSYLNTLEIEGVILTGGNDLATVNSASNPAPERDGFERELIDYALEETMPLLGVCRGMQLLNVFFDGKLSTVDDHVATDHDITFDGDNKLRNASFPEITTKVNSYHRYGIGEQGLAADLQVLAYASDGTIECCTHPDHPLYGVMWHPERGERCETDETILTRLFGDPV